MRLTGFRRRCVRHRQRFLRTSLEPRVGNFPVVTLQRSGGQLLRHLLEGDVAPTEFFVAIAKLCIFLCQLGGLLCHML